MRSVIEKYYNELLKNVHDIKGEALVNQALQHEILRDDIVILNDGRFFREYRQDVYAIDQIEDNWRHQLLQLRLSRSGLYDLLPEGLFHQPMADRKSNKSAAEMAAHSRRDKKKETATRKFFQPVENGFFWQRVLIEREEENLLAGMDSGLLNDYFFTFWGFPEGLNKTSAMLLVLLLPYAHAIAGDIRLMHDCLEILLQEKVQILTVRPEINTAGQAPNSLGIGELGNDLVCGATFTEDYPCLQYIIGPLKNTKAVEYCAGGENDILLQVFNSYFAPAEADITIQIEVDRSDALIELNEETSPILGYSCAL
jgi:hypothetical protein